MNHTESLVYHEPIFPSDSLPVTFFFKILYGEIESVKLFEKIEDVEVQNFDSSDRTKYLLLKEWTTEDVVDNMLSFTNSKPYNNNKYITYKFEVKGLNEINSYNHIVHFQTQSNVSIYSKDSLPIAVYRTNPLIDKSYNITFIPDVNLDLNDFYNSVLNHIKNTFLYEQTLNRFRLCFNFYINPLNATPGDFDNPDERIKPDNSMVLEKISDCNIILHNINIIGRRDFQFEKYFGSKYNEYGTLLHEFGHMLNLTDEYRDGKLVTYYDNANDYIFKNVWEDKDIVEKYCTDRFINTNKIKMFYVGVTNPQAYYKICSNDCNMNNAGTKVRNYDVACQNRIIFILSQRSGFMNSNKSANFLEFNQTNQIKLLNDYNESEIRNYNHSHYDYSWTKDENIITINFQYKNGELNILHNGYKLLKQKVSFQLPVNSNLIIDFLNKEFKSVKSYTISNPFVIRSCYNSKTFFKFSDDSSFFLKMPKYSGVKYLNFKESGKSIKFINIDISSVFYKLDTNVFYKFCNFIRLCKKRIKSNFF
jgi:hypothetical protein